MEKTCIHCGEKVIGRSDKKFCSDYCRSAYNNKVNGSESKYIRQVNGVLRKNRKILLTLNPNGKAKARKEEMLNAGFNFKFFTNVYKTKSGKVYFFCYDQGYLKIDNEYYALVEREEWI